MKTDSSPQLLPMLLIGAIGALILLLGFTLFLYYEPIDQQAGNTNARITGVYKYDLASGQKHGNSTVSFTSKDVPAAVVDWTSVPAGMEVGAHWFDDHGQVIGGVGPGAAPSLPTKPIPIDVDAETLIPPGVYVFVVERYSGGRSVQVLARSAIKVDEQ
ncbi:MAG TPA: hypothetical protein VG329_09430 [Candidatus Dormibacteraeota bacterium]|nr:hypothetical protein [Candidatus Dormibacteraeota bacterium]